MDVPPTASRPSFGFAEYLCFCNSICKEGCNHTDIVIRLVLEAYFQRIVIFQDECRAETCQCLAQQFEFLWITRSDNGNAFEMQQPTELDNELTHGTVGGV